MNKVSKRLLACLIMMALTITGTACTSGKNPLQAASVHLPTQQSQNVVAATPQPSAEKSGGTERKLIDAKVLKVSDGDTMTILINGKKETIRLLLVDTPESVHPKIPDPQPYAIEASNYAKKMLNNKKVKIEIDVSERDRYGRLLCYLYIGEKMFNELLLEKGYARVAYVIPPNVKYVDRFRAIQKKAQQQAIGIWSIENYAQEDGFDTNAVKKESSPSKSKTTAQPVKPKTEEQVYYKNCSEAKKAGAAPVRKGDPGYGKHLDRDGDGIACER
ncbi:thermonuclease family protein [Paenibacillus abyssi]|uniref:SPBc2 prophage-derived endonuclease YokF n=1 Tax=Paenibacillus abyssi TaxID=1340531 RepID=A0A917LFI6_9BACL|nr:thermonuclease family protein [Paenibacillus abyssi]GGG17902.1 SPBc2 prophage-derived endonuclease YokF [Paenibacillus abyssi]